jgi:hypothetical protein
MVSEIRLAGFTLTADEWFGLDAETREELLGVGAAANDVDDEPLELSAGPSDIVW